MEPMEGPLGTRTADGADFKKEYIVIRGSHLFLWSDPETYERNCEEDMILDLRGMSLALGLS